MRLCLIDNQAADLKPLRRNARCLPHRASFGVTPWNGPDLEFEAMDRGLRTRSQKRDPRHSEAIRDATSWRTSTPGVRGSAQRAPEAKCYGAWYCPGSKQPGRLVLGPGHAAPSPGLPDAHPGLEIGVPDR